MSGLGPLVAADRADNHPHRMEKKIEIVFTDESGVAHVIASTLWAAPLITTSNFGTHAEARRSMSAGDQMAVSRLCLYASANMFAVDPTSHCEIAAVKAWHDADPATWERVERLGPAAFTKNIDGATTHTLASEVATEE